MICLIAELGRNLPVSGKNLRGSMDFLPVSGVMGGDLRGLRPAKAAPCDGFFDLLAARTGRFKVLGGVALYVGSATLSSLNLVAKIAKPEGQLRLIDGGGELLGIEEPARLQSAGRTIGEFGHVEDYGMGMELRSGVPIDRAGGVMFELCGNKFAGGLGGIVAADPGLRIPLQLRERDGHGLPVGLTHTIVATNQRGKRDGFGCRERRVPPRTMFDRLHSGSVSSRVFLSLAMLD
jgi:hypothetical protein